MKNKIPGLKPTCKIYWKCDNKQHIMLTIFQATVVRFAVKLK